MNLSSMRRHASARWIGTVATICLLITLLFCSSPALAQANSRKLKTRVDPVYPEVARRNNVRGTARVELVIAQDGRVKDVKVLGGHPILVEAVMEVINKWKYEPATEESTVIVKFDFGL